MDQDGHTAPISTMSPTIRGDPELDLRACGHTPIITEPEF
jgi:hypothetical protein